MRTFVSLPLEGEASVAAEAVLLRLRAIAARQGVRFVSPEKLHVTISFLGEVADEDMVPIVEVVSRLQPSIGTLNLNGLVGFPTLARPRIVALSVAGLGLDQAAEQIRAAVGTLGYADDKPFSPHLTLARIKPGSRQVGKIVSEEANVIGQGPLATWLPNEVWLMQTMADGSYRRLVAAAVKPPDSASGESPTS